MTAPNMASIAAQVAQAHGLSVAELRSDTRERHVAWPRQEAYAAMNATGRYSTSQIGRFFGRDHTTVLYGIAAHVARQARAAA